MLLTISVAVAAVRKYAIFYHNLWFTWNMSAISYGITQQYINEYIYVWEVAIVEKNFGWYQLQINKYFSISQLLDWLLSLWPNINKEK